MRRNRLVHKIYWVSGFLAVFTLIYLGSILFLHPSSVGNPFFGRLVNIWAVVWTVNFLIVFALTFVLARDLIKLLFEYQANRSGSRIKAKLVGSHILVSLLPALILSFLALGLINGTLDRWFTSPSRQILRSARQVEANYYDLHRRFMLQVLRSTAAGIEEGASDLTGIWTGLGEREGVKGMLLLDSQGTIVAGQGDWVTPQTLEQASQAVRSGWGEIQAGGSFYEHRKSSQTDTGLGGSTTYDYGFAGLPLAGGRDPRGALLVRFILPESTHFYRIGIEEAFAALGTIEDDENSLRISYFSILGLTTLAVVFSFVWLANYIARRITAPIEALAEGSQQLAGGNLDHRVEVEAFDELGVLVTSFNQMAQQLRSNRRDLEKANAELTASNAQLDQRRRYIEAIVHNIAAGVLSVDPQDRVRSINEAALQMFSVRREEAVGKRISDFADQEFWIEFSSLKKRAGLYGTYRKELPLKPGDRELRIAATITMSTDDDGRTEYLLVLDDLTELIQAEKFAAWQEVARRLAHEIKNPLTPIQLSAERVQKRFDKLVKRPLPASGELEDFGKVLGEATEVIVAEAEMLKTLVLEFSRFARLPASHLREVSIHDLINRTLALYDGGLHGVHVHKSFDPAVGLIPLDPDQMQRAFINLINNSLEAMAEQGGNGSRELWIETRANDARSSVRLTISDSGPGIAAEDYGSLFLPYFSTKKKGTGLGLAIVRQIVSEHSGSIRAEPNHPSGTRFVMELPLG